LSDRKISRDIHAHPEVDDLLCKDVNSYTMNISLESLEVVALLVDLPEFDLVVGQVGTAVERLDDEVYEVEFCDDEGRTYAEPALQAGQLMALRYSPLVA